MQPLISVIIPNYNHASFLEARIDSVVNQTYSNIEIILLDDHSTDGSIEILKRYESLSKVVVLDINSSNSGSTFKQWAKGMGYASGEWIWIAESDDISHPKFLESLIDRADRDTVLCWCRSNIIDGEGKKTTYLGQSQFPNVSYWNDFKPGNQSLDGEAFILNQLYKFNHLVNTSSVIFKTEYYPLHKQDVLSSFHLCGDWFVWVHIISKGKATYIDEALNDFRIHANTVREHSESKIFAFFENLIIIKDISKMYTLSSERISIYTQYLIYIYTNRYPRKDQLSLTNLFPFIRFLASFNVTGAPLLFKHLIKN